MQDYRNFFEPGLSILWHRLLRRTLVLNEFYESKRMYKKLTGLEDLLGLKN